MTADDRPRRPPPRLTLAVERDDTEVALVLRGDLDLAATDAVDRAMRAVRAAGPGRVVLDLRRVGFVDSTGLRLLISLRNDAKREGRDLVLVPGPRQVQRVFELTGTRGLFDWRDA